MGLHLFQKYFAKANNTKVFLCLIIHLWFFFTSIHEVSLVGSSSFKHTFIYKGCGMYILYIKGADVEYMCFCVFAFF